MSSHFSVLPLCETYATFNFQYSIFNFRARDCDLKGGDAGTVAPFHAGAWPPVE